MNANDTATNRNNNNNNNDDNNNNRNNENQNDHRFPARLHYMLRDMEEDGLDSIISFCPGGTGVIIKDKKRLLKVLPLWFRQTKVESFLRQLKNYGFQRSYRGPTRGGYDHPLFIRDRPELCERIHLIPVPTREDEVRAGDPAPDAHDDGSNEDGNHNMDIVPAAVAVPALIYVPPPAISNNMLPAAGVVALNEEPMGMPFPSTTAAGAPQVLFFAPTMYNTSSLNSLSTPYMSCNEIMGNSLTGMPRHSFIPMGTSHFDSAFAGPNYGEGLYAPRQGASYLDLVRALKGYNQPSSWPMTRQQQIERETLMALIKMMLAMSSNSFHSMGGYNK